MVSLNQHPNFGFKDPTTPKPGSSHELSIYYVPLDRQVSFKAFITDFSDQFSTNWEGEEIYGRMDPVQTFKSTTRTISVGFDVVAASEKEAKINLAKISELASMHYPVYSEHDAGTNKGGSATALNQSPLLRVKYMNLICKNGEGIANGSVKTSGLLVASSGFTFAPQMDDVMFGSGGNLYPKFVKISLSLSVIHEHGMGFDEKGKRVKSFPYNDDGTNTPAVLTKKVDDQILTGAVNQSTTLEDAVKNGTATEEEIKALEEKIGMSLPR